MGVIDHLMQESSFSVASGQSYQYVVLQVTLKEKFFGTGSGNLTELEEVINNQAKKGYRLHTISTANGGSKGLVGGDRIQATLVFEKITEARKVEKHTPAPVPVAPSEVHSGESVVPTVLSESEVVCPVCGRRQPHGRKMCFQCGTPFDKPAPSDT